MKKEKTMEDSNQQEELTPLEVPQDKSLYEQELELTDSIWKRLAIWLRVFFCIEGNPTEESYTARQASLYAYNRTIELDDSKRVKEFIKKVNRQIKDKCEKFETNCTYNLPVDLLKYEDDILRYFKDKGFDIHNLKKDTNFVKGDILYIDWDNKF